MKKLILIDGNAVIHRAYHALPPFRTKTGELVNAVYGFASVLLNVLNTEKPDYIAVSFDLAGKTFRHEEYKEYKATRVKAPQDLYDQIPRIKELVRTFNVPIYEMEGFEADDILGTMAKEATKIEDLKIYIFTGDMDTLQLVDKKINVLTPAKGLSSPVIYDVQKVLGKYGINPEQIPDMKGLQGDNSDNIKGVTGIGPKTAHDLLQKYGNLENIYDHLDETTGKVYENLKRDKENAFFSRKMATIITDVPIKFDLEKCKTHEYEKDRVTTLFNELNFKSLLPRLGKFNDFAEENNAKENPNQQVLF